MALSGASRRKQIPSSPPPARGRGKTDMKLRTEEQFHESQFGANHSFLIDFHHVGEYLAAAAKEVGDVAGEAGRYRGWKDKMLADKA